MAVIPIDPSFAVSGAEWNVGGVNSAHPPGTPTTANPASGTGSSEFGGMLAEQIGALEKTQTEAAAGARALAAGTATDPTAVVMAVDHARLSMQFASTIRTKAVEAVQDIFHTQV